MRRLRRYLALCALAQLSLSVASCGGDSKRTAATSTGGVTQGSGGKGGVQQSAGGGATASAVPSTGTPDGGGGDGDQGDGRIAGQTGISSTDGTTALGGTTGTVQGGSAIAGGFLTGGAASGGTSLGSTALGGTTGVGGSSTGGGALGGTTVLGGTTGSTGLGGSGGSMGGTTGQPLTGPDKTWTWIDFADAHCRNGSSTGLGLNLSSSSPNVMIFLDQGGACFNAITCAANAASYGASNFGSGPGGGIFDRNDAANPLRDHSFIFIPYCTGDVHAGNNPSGSVSGVTGTQQFVGYRNLDVFLRRLVPTFARATQVLLTGSSAGGFGALMNAHHVARAFGGIPVTVLDDSGPGMPSTVVPTCLQERWRTLWGFDQTVLADCGSDCPHSNEYMMDLALHYPKAYPQAHTGLISSTQDQVIRLFFGFGANDCSATLTLVGETSYANGLTTFRASADSAGAKLATYYISSPASDATHHIWLMDSSYYAKSVGGTDLRSWVGALLAGNAQHVGP